MELRTKVYQYDNGSFSMGFYPYEDAVPVQEYAPNEEITVYTSKGFQPFLMGDGSDVHTNPDFEPCEMKMRAYEVATHNDFDDRFKIYGTKEALYQVMDEQRKLVPQDVQEHTVNSRGSVGNGVVFMDQAVGGMDHEVSVEKEVSDALLDRVSSESEHKASSPVGNGVIFMDDAVLSASNPDPKPTYTEPETEYSTTAFAESESKLSDESVKSDAVFTSSVLSADDSRPVVLKNVPVSQVFKTKREGTKVVRVMSDSVPSGSFAFSMNDDFIKANRENGKVTSYDVNIGLPGFYKDVSFKVDDGYKHMNMGVLDILDKFQAQPQSYKAGLEHSDSKPVYLNFMDRQNIKDASDGVHATVYVPSEKSDDNLLRIQVKKDQVLVSRFGKTVVPGKFNVRLDGDAVHQAFVVKDGKITELEGGVAAKDLVASYMEYQNQMRVERTAGVTKAPDVQQDKGSSQFVSSSIEVNPNSDEPVFSNFSEAMAFDGGFSM